MNSRFTLFFLVASAVLTQGTAALPPSEQVADWDFQTSYRNAASPNHVSGWQARNLPLSALFVHQIRPGDTLQKIARLYRVSAHDIACINQVDPSKALVAGLTLRIPEE
jgi:LysM domain